jgi:hypothetical protein
VIAYCSNIFSIRFSVLPALCLDGIIHCDIVEGSFDSELFYLFISRLLDQMQPFPAPNSVIVMDNCRIHKNPVILELIKSRSVSIYILWIFIDTAMNLEECGTSSCHPTHRTTIQSSWHFRR